MPEETELAGGARHWSKNMGLEEFFFSEISVFGFPKSWKYQVPPNHPKLYGWPWLRNLKPMVLKWDPKNDVECNISEVDNGVNSPTTNAVSSNPQKYLLLISPSVFNSAFFSPIAPTLQSLRYSSKSDVFFSTSKCHQAKLSKVTHAHTNYDNMFFWSWIEPFWTCGYSNSKTLDLIIESLFQRWSWLSFRYQR